MLSLSTPNVYFAQPERQAEVARLVNDAYADLAARHPTRFKGFASIPMDDPDAALRELERTQGELRMNGVIVLSNINGRALTDPIYRPFFVECDRRRVCVFIHPMIPASAEPFAEYVLGPIAALLLRRGRRPHAKQPAKAQPSRTPVSSVSCRTSAGSSATSVAPCRISWRAWTTAAPVLLRRGPKATRQAAGEGEAEPYDTVSFSAPSLRLTRELVGADHMVMGSDYPHLLGSIDRAVSRIESLDIPAADRERIFSETARDILNNV